MTNMPFSAVVCDRQAWRRVLSKVCVLAVAGVLPLSAARAVTNVTTTFAVNVTVQSTCLISVTPLAFGTYTGTLITSTTTVTITCTNTTPYNVGLSAGGASGATVTTRKMTLSSTTLSYVLTQDAAHATNWGVTVGTDTVAGTGNGAAQAITVYGQVAAGQYVTPGAYADSITATVTF
jgi:spore coat protein U-like protein